MQKKLIYFSFFLSLLVVDSKAYSWWMWTPGDTVDDPGFKPTQPIPFSHQKHAGQLNMPCQYCHSSARKASTAGIPPMNTCMGCHKIVKTDSPHIQKLTKYFEKNEPMPWVKIYDLPDFVHFPHKNHIAAGLECQQCHGRVEKMEKVEQVAPMQMGWCMSCHTAVGAPNSCVTCHY